MDFFLMQGLQEQNPHRSKAPPVFRIQKSVIITLPHASLSSQQKDLVVFPQQKVLWLGVSGKIPGSNLSGAMNSLGAPS